MTTFPAGVTPTAVVTYADGEYNAIMLASANDLADPGGDVHSGWVALFIEDGERQDAGPLAVVTETPLTTTPPVTGTSLYLSVDLSEQNTFTVATAVEVSDEVNAWLATQFDVIE